MTDGRSPAYRALLAARGTPGEREALDAVYASGALAEESVRLLAAEIHLDRDEPGSALRLLRRQPSLRARLLEARTLEEVGRLEEALDRFEEILLDDLDAPGAMIARNRLLAKSGRASDQVGGDSAHTLISPNVDETPYRILREVGRGRNGVVYEAFDDALGRPVALKVFHRPAEHRQRLLHEARTAIELAGPGVVRIFDADADAGWIAMEWARHETLRAHLSRRDVRWLTPPSDWLTPFMVALARVHAAGWVHGDLKPENVLFRGRARPVLGDFGAAQEAGGPVTEATERYAPPERFTGGVAQPSDDVFAAGCILVEVLEAIDQSRAHPCWEVARRAKSSQGRRPADGRALLQVLRDACPSGLG